MNTPKHILQAYTGQQMYSSDKPFVGAFFFISCVDDNEERISQFFSHKEMARAFIESCDVVENEMLYIGVVRDEEHKKFLLDNIEKMV
jgi:hypothetical protein